jgi:hypothetical protein
MIEQIDLKRIDNRERSVTYGIVFIHLLIQHGVR